MSIYLHVTLKVKMSGYQKFCDAMDEAVPILEGLGWKLVGAWVTNVGRLHTVIDLWEIKDANAYYSVMKKYSSRKGYGEFWDVLAETLEEEVVTMVSRAPYDHTQD